MQVIDFRSLVVGRMLFSGLFYWQFLPLEFQIDPFTRILVLGNACDNCYLCRLMTNICKCVPFRISLKKIQALCHNSIMPDSAIWMYYPWGRGFYCSSFSTQLFISRRVQHANSLPRWHVCRTLWHDDDWWKEVFVRCIVFCRRHALMRAWVGYHRACSCAQRLRLFLKFWGGFPQNLKVRCYNIVSSGYVKFLLVYPEGRNFTYFEDQNIFKKRSNPPFSPWNFRQKVSLLLWMQSIYACLWKSPMWRWGLRPITRSFYQRILLLQWMMKTA